jgi:hypothetical protein
LTAFGGAGFPDTPWHEEQSVESDNPSVTVERSQPTPKQKSPIPSNETPQHDRRLRSDVSFR